MWHESAMVLPAQMFLLMLLPDFVAMVEIFIGKAMHNMSQAELYNDLTRSNYLTT